MSRLTDGEEMRKQEVKIVQDKDKPVAANILAQAIMDVAEGMRQVSRSRLSREALIVLIHDRSKISKRDITLVLNNLDQLERTWLK